MNAASGAFELAGAMVCYAKCTPCMYGQCPGGDHRWAEQEDIEHAALIGKPESAEGRCGCPCALGPELDEAPEPDEGPVWVSLDGTPCRSCGAEGACSYDDEGRALIHATDEPDEESA